MTTELTARQRELLRAALSYALSNIEDLNECFCSEEDDDPGWTEREVVALARALGLDF